MNRDKDTQAVPVCRFGPGGDFSFIWPTRFSEVAQPLPNSLAKLLNSAADMLTILLGLEPDSAASPPATAIKIECDFQGQPILFSDGCRVSLKAEHKPRQHIRIHRRAVKKKPDPNIQGQGLLFESYRKNARTA